MYNFYILTGGKLVVSVSRATNKPIYGLSTKERAELLVKSEHYPDFEEVSKLFRGVLNNVGANGIYSIKPVTETYVEHIFTKMEIEKCVTL